MRCVLGPVSVLKFIWRCSRAKAFQRLVMKKVATLFDGSGQSELIREIRAAAGLITPILFVYTPKKWGTAACRWNMSMAIDWYLDESHAGAQY